jgi:opacity protein-like surface antigen
MFGKRTLAAGAILLASVVAANATDITPIAPPPPPPPPPAPVFSWDGFYVGGYGGLIHAFGAAIAQVGAQVGFNFTSGAFLGGVELQAEWRGPPAFASHFGVGANARAGFIIGTNFLVYGEGGIHWQSLFAPGTYWTAGGGAEMALGTAISIFAEAAAVGTFTGFCCALQVQAGLNWHP